MVQKVIVHLSKFTRKDSNKHYKKKDIIQQILLQQKKIDVIYILLHLLVVFFFCNSNLNLLHQYEIIAIIIMLH